MSKTVLKYLACFVIFISCYLLIGFFLNGIISLLATLLVTAALCYVIIKFLSSKNEKPKTKEPPKKDEERIPTQPSPEKLIGQLVDLNLECRLQGFSAEVLAKIESLFDKLIQVLPEMNEKFPGTESTWIINRLVTEYLPRLISEFKDLAENVRLEKATSFIESVASIDLTLEKIRKLVEASNRSPYYFSLFCL